MSCMQERRLTVATFTDYWAVSVVAVMACVGGLLVFLVAWSDCSPGTGDTVQVRLTDDNGQRIVCRTGESRRHFRFHDIHVI